MANLTHAAERQAIALMLDGLLKHLNNNENKVSTYLKIVDLAERFYGKTASKEKLAAVRAALQDENNRWTRMINDMIETTDPPRCKDDAAELGL